MITTVALTLSGPMMTILAMLIAAVVGGAGGYALGTTVGRTAVPTPLPVTIRLAREGLASAAERLEAASKKLNGSARRDLAGSPLTLARRISEISNDLGRIEHKAKRSREESS